MFLTHLIEISCDYIVTQYNIDNIILPFMSKENEDKKKLSFYCVTRKMKGTKFEIMLQNIFFVCPLRLKDNDIVYFQSLIYVSIVWWKMDEKQCVFVE